MSEEEGLERADPLGIKIHEKVQLKKFVDVPPEHEHDPEKYGHKPFETIIVEDGKPTEVIRGERDAEEEN